MQGCATAFLGVALLGFNGSEAFRIFTSMALVITGVGGLFALWGLPALLALLSRLLAGGGACGARGRDEPKAPTGAWVQPR
mmetsp:Transcript_120425/g.374986  ORF Transcript_120425/g.374986 Transcript_120425/m.374986 type:complete len:81 (-) Transcript_120425:50-292(-)